MPIYTFKSSDGETIEEAFSMRGAPEIGTPITRNGKQYLRVMSLDGAVNVQKEFKPYVSMALAKNTPGFKHDARGRCVVESRQQERAYAKRVGMEFVTSKE